jgi:hypothetical protein
VVRKLDIWKSLKLVAGKQGVRYLSPPKSLWRVTPPGPGRAEGAGEKIAAGPRQQRGPGRPRLGSFLGMAYATPCLPANKLHDHPTPTLTIKSTLKNPPTWPRENTQHTSTTSTFLESGFNYWLDPAEPRLGRRDRAAGVGVAVELNAGARCRSRRTLGP